MLDKHLSAGDKLPTEKELGDMFGVSRNVIREAIKALEITGVVKSSPGIGIVIQEYNLDFMFQQAFFFLVSDNRALINEIQDIRKVLELGYARDTFAAITEEQMKELRELLERMEYKCFKKQYYDQEDMNFHLKLHESLNNHTLNAILLAYWEVDSNFNTPIKLDHLEKSYRDHVAIVEALEAKNFERFYTALENHFYTKIYVFSSD